MIKFYKPGEMAIIYRQAAFKKKQIQIFCDILLCEREKVIDMLIDEGISTSELPVYTHRMCRDTVVKELPVDARREIREEYEQYGEKDATYIAKKYDVKRSTVISYAIRVGKHKRMTQEEYIAYTRRKQNTLTDYQKKYIRENYKFNSKEFGAVPLAKRFGASRNQIYNVINGKI